MALPSPQSPRHTATWRCGLSSNIAFRWEIIELDGELSSKPCLMIGWFILVIVQKRRFYNVLYGFIMFYHSLAWFIPMHCVHGNPNSGKNDFLKPGMPYLATQFAGHQRGFMRRPQTWKHVCDFANDAGQPRWPNRAGIGGIHHFFFKDTIDLFWLEEKEHKKHSRGLAGKILALKTFMDIVSIFYIYIILDILYYILYSMIWS
jgi:hypothetical protein